jgi:hypothetical protein
MPSRAIVADSLADRPFCIAYARGWAGVGALGIAGLQSSARTLICAESELGRRWVSSRRPRSPVCLRCPHPGRQRLRSRRYGIVSVTGWLCLKVLVASIGCELMHCSSHPSAARRPQIAPLPTAGLFFSLGTLQKILGGLCGLTIAGILVGGNRGKLFLSAVAASEEIKVSGNRSQRGRDQQRQGRDCEQRRPHDSLPMRFYVIATPGRGLVKR